MSSSTSGQMSLSREVRGRDRRLDTRRAASNGFCGRVSRRLSSVPCRSVFSPTALSNDKLPSVLYRKEVHQNDCHMPVEVLWLRTNSRPRSTVSLSAPYFVIIAKIADGVTSACETAQDPRPG